MRSYLIANISKVNSLGAIVPALFNLVITNKFTSGLLKKILGFAPERSIPKLYRMTLHSWIKNNKLTSTVNQKGKVYLFVDEFTNYNDTEIGIKAVKLLNGLGYQVVVPKHIESGRTYLSKGLIRKAKQIAIRNVNLLKDIITEQTPLIGIEPSGILSFRDEYTELVGPELKNVAIKLAKSCLLFDEFIVREVEKGNITHKQFTDVKQNIRLHGHCHQKAIASTASTAAMLSLPFNYTVEELKTGCCGMAGAFGYEKEHYTVSMKVGNLRLFPEVKKTPQETIISAPGTSCRHQIKDGTGRIALHPIEVLFNALNK
jgi:Fe-S oxidoreductase